MRMLIAVLLLILAAIHPHAEAGLLGSTPIAVSCGMTITVTDDIAFQTLTLDNTDPIVTTVCTSDGLTIKNSGHGSIDRGLALDCQGKLVRGLAKGIGVELKGPNLSAMNCQINGFKNGIVLNGDGGSLQDNQVQKAADDGIVLKDSVSLKNDNLLGSTIVGNRAIDNGGWGFNLKGNEMSVGTGTFFNNFALGNGEGGFLVKGDGVALVGNDAIGNGGPGFSVTSTSCCAGAFGQFFSSALAINNAGPGVIYKAKNDGSNCVGSSDPACTGGTFFPTGFDTQFGAIVSTGNGADCPKGSLHSAPGVCPVTTGAKCSQSALDHC